MSQLTQEQLAQLVSRLSTESDTQLAKAFGIHRKSVWRIRQNHLVPKPTKAVEVKVDRESTIPPPPVQEPPVVAVPPQSDVPTDEVQKTRAKPEPVTVILSTYIGVQLLKFEQTKDVVRQILDAAAARNILFRKIQVLAQVTIGVGNFVLVRADIPDAFDIVQDLLLGRGVINMINGTYVVRYPDGRSGKVPASTISIAPKIGFGQTYAGTKIKRWKQQFAA